MKNKFLIFFLAISFYSLLFSLIYMAHIHFFRVNVIFYASLLDSLIALIFFLITFVLSIGITFVESRTTTVVRTTSLVFLFIGLITLSMLSYLSNSVPLLIIIMGILILVYLLILYALYNAEWICLTSDLSSTSAHVFWTYPFVKFFSSKVAQINAFLP